VSQGGGPDAAAVSGEQFDGATCQVSGPQELALCCVKSLQTKWNEAQMLS
jgi:hypothetical protein